MLKRDELEDTNSCLNKAHDGERLFVLLARDPAAPVAIRAWVAARLRLGKNVTGDAQIEEALECAALMERERAARLRYGGQEPIRWAGGGATKVDAALIVDQPPPIANRRPTWELVISYVEQLQLDSSYVVLGNAEDAIALVLTDMRARDAVGRVRYGTPLTAGNGRDHLIDAYQELLDGCVYLMNELDECGVGITTKLTVDNFPAWSIRWYLYDVQQLCIEQIRASICLRVLIKERSERSRTAVKGTSP